MDVVVCCSDSFFAGVSVASREFIQDRCVSAGCKLLNHDAADYPMAAVPLGYIESSGRPYGLQAIAPANQEAKLIRFMAAWEQCFPPRRVPDLEACARARAER